jgi:NADH-quinone oxidoreductase subunit M
LSSLGLPGTAGFVAEFLVFLGAWQGATPWWAVAGAAGALLTAVYVLRATRTIFWGQGPPPAFAHLEDAKFFERIALWMLGVSIVVLGVWPRLMLDLIDGTTVRYLATIVSGAVGGAP